MTGVYPWRLGLQRGAIERFQATGLDPNRVLLPELLHKGGYSTHLVNCCQIIFIGPRSLFVSKSPAQLLSDALDLYDVIYLGDLCLWQCFHRKIPC